MSVMRYFLIASALVLILGHPPVYAQSEEPIAFARTSVTILRNTPPAMPWATGAPTDAAVPLVLDVDRRDAAILYRNDGWFNLGGLSEKKGLFLILPYPTIAPLTRSAHYAPVDVVFIDEQGVIVQTAPMLVLSELKEEMYPQSEIKAFLLLKGGSCEKLSIRPADKVRHDIFTSAPHIISKDPQTPTKRAAPIVDVKAQSVAPTPK
jgi:uncharacterized membrane protein (UPF0127 family)